MRHCWGAIHEIPAPNNRIRHELQPYSSNRQRAPNTGMEPTRFARPHEWHLACSSFWLTRGYLLGPRAAHAAAVVRQANLVLLVE